jgi:tRNA A37 threonylcarbamoyltransferase TsaD
MINKIKVGDTVLIEQCWEDAAGNYHDEYAKIIEIAPDGTLKLEWQVERQEIKDWLDTAEYNIGDLED